MELLTSYTTPDTTVQIGCTSLCEREAVLGSVCTDLCNSVVASAMAFVEWLSPQLTISGVALPTNFFTPVLYKNFFDCCCVLQNRMQMATHTLARWHNYKNLLSSSVTRVANVGLKYTRNCWAVGLQLEFTVLPKERWGEGREKGRVGEEGRGEGEGRVKRRGGSLARIVPVLQKSVIF